GGLPGRKRWEDTVPATAGGSGAASSSVRPRNPSLRGFNSVNKSRNSGRSESIPSIKAVQASVSSSAMLANGSKVARILSASASVTSRIRTGTVLSGGDIGSQVAIDQDELAALVLSR